MTRLSRFLSMAMIAAFASGAIAACGDDDDGDGGGGATGGEITISQTSQPDYLDPALSYTVNGWEPMWLVYTPLITYRHAEGEEGAQLVPGLAQALPEISSNGRTYTLTLRQGLRYSDGTPVKASDFEHTIKRVLNLESGGAAFYSVIEGADEYVEAGDAEADIAGIDANDRTGEITIRLTKPDGTFQHVLAMNFAGLVPGDTPFENLTKNPPPGVGAYKITRSVPNREFVMEKNEHFPGFDGVPQAKIDKITTKIIKNATRQARQVISGELDYMQDPPPADIKPEVKERYSDRYREFTTVSTFYVFMNHRVPPFDDPQVREAINIGLNKPALARIFAGEMAPGCSFLPPGMPGHDEALDTTDCPWGDPNAKPDLARARQMIEEAGAAGEEVTVWGNNDDPTDKVTEAIADQFTQMGFNAEPEIVDGGVYFQTIGNQKTKAQAGFLNWFQDFPHPYNFFFLVDGASIQDTNNQNVGNVDDPEINAELEELRTETDLEAVTDRWSALDRQLVEEAHVAPYGHRKLATFMSERMDFDNCALVHPVYQNDYSSWCLKE
jgi:peptide/nickel transport system substrate-binding protein